MMIGALTGLVRAYIWMLAFFARDRRHARRELGMLLSGLHDAFEDERAAGKRDTWAALRAAATHLAELRPTSVVRQLRDDAARSPLAPGLSGRRLGGAVFVAAVSIATIGAVADQRLGPSGPGHIAQQVALNPEDPLPEGDPLAHRPQDVAPHDAIPEQLHRAEPPRREATLLSDARLRELRVGVAILRGLRGDAAVLRSPPPRKTPCPAA